VFRPATAMDDDNDDVREDSGGEHDYHSEGEGEEETPFTVPGDTSGSLPPLRTRGHNTGVKGVRADYEEAKIKMVIKREMERERRYRECEKNSFVTLTAREEEAMREQEQRDREELEALEDDEDAYMELYRAQRMRQMQQQARKAKFGRLKHITLDDFLDEVEQEDPSVVVVVHLYEPGHEACERTNGCLYALAPEHPTVKFLKAVSTDLKPDWDPFALPTLIVYQGGQYKTSLIRITENLGTRFSAHDLEQLLIKEEVLTELPSR